MENKYDKLEHEMEEKLKRDARTLKVPNSLEPSSIVGSIEKLQVRKKRKLVVRFGRIHKFAVVAAGIAMVLFLTNVVSLDFSHLGMGVKNNDVDQEEDAYTTTNKDDTNKNDTNAIRSNEHVAADYEEVYDTVKVALTNQRNYLYGISEDMVLENGAVTSGTGLRDESATSDKNSQNKEHADTNVQVKGVDEGDIVKNDGDYIYCLSGSSIRIVKAEGEELTEVSKVTIDGMVSEFYVQSDRLVVIYSIPYNEKHDTSDYSRKLVYNDQSAVRIYDISNRSKPSKLKEFQQDGYVVSSRISEGYLYLFTNRTVGGEVAQKDLNTYIPKVDGEYIEACNIAMPPYTNVSNYLVISSVKIDAPSKLVSTKAVLSGAFQFYVSANAIYSVENTTVFPYAIRTEEALVDTVDTPVSNDATSSYRVEQDKSKVTSPDKSSSRVMKYKYDQGKITFVAEAEVDGTVDDQFSLDEYKGYLRMVATVDDYKNNYTTYNNLYVLDDKLKKVGEITNLAKEERIYSARFMGDTGYFVTFRQVDPLFSVDLSDPKNPKILGELKITGFSSYLHCYDDHLLLGIGQEVDPNTNRTIGVKLSMFDISDPKNVKEVHKKVLKDMTYGEFLNNHKAIMIDPVKNIFGFDGYSNDEVNTNGFRKYYHVFSYDKEKGFVEEMKVISSGEAEKEGYDYSVRGTYIQDTLYVLSLQPSCFYDSDEKIKGIASVITSYDLKTGKENGTLRLNNK